jgi:CPA1 family monovalent cation:H+ antiporter
MQQFLQVETLVIALLLTVSMVAAAVRRLQIPYTVALVVAGLFIATQGTPQIRLVPELILALFVPPLAFEAAFHLNWRELRHDLPALFLLAGFGVGLTTLIVGGMVSLVAPFGLPLALLFGALTAATDPVAVIAVFRKLGVPRRLGILIEGESLLNDGTAIVVFNLMLAAVLSGRFSLLGGAIDLVRVAAGGVAVGLALGWVISWLIAGIDDYLIETTLTTVLAFGSYLVAERLRVSGVLAVVAAGLVAGNIGPRGMSAATRVVLFNLWEYIAFVANSLVFLLIGLQVDLPALAAAWQLILWSVAAVLVARALVVYGLALVANRLGERIPLRWQHVLTWGGLRGAITLALALSLPDRLGQAGETLRLMAFGMVLFTLLVQGTTMGPLVRWLGLVGRSPEQAEYELRRARLVSLQVAGRQLERIYREGSISPHAWQVLRPELEQRANALAKALAELVQAYPSLRAEELEAARREVIHAQRAALMGMRRDGLLSQEAYEQLSAEIAASQDEEAGDLPPAGATTTAG